MSFSIILLILGRRDMGLWWLQFHWPTFLKIGITLACFIVSGKVPGEKDELITSDTSLNKNFLKSLRILVRTPPAPVFHVFSVLTISSTSSIVVSDRQKCFCLNVLIMNLKILDYLNMIFCSWREESIKMVWNSKIICYSFIAIFIFRVN